MEKQIERQCRANAVFTDEAYLKTRYICREDGTYTIRVGRGRRAGAEGMAAGAVDHGNA